MTNDVTQADNANRLLDRLDRLYVAVVSDILDQLGYRSQVLTPAIRPLFREARVVGYASTIETIDVDRLPARREDYYAMELAAIDTLQPEQVLVVSASSGGCFWGELLATAARARGARGIVVDGYTRDCQGLISMGFPTFVSGIYAADGLGRIEVARYGERISCGGVCVEQGDLVIADFDGVVTIPAAVAAEVIQRAEEKVQGEDLVRVKLSDGMPVTEAFRRYGVM